MTSTGCVNTQLNLWKYASTILHCSKRLAGHSHWQNVKNTKEAKDREKSRNAQYYSRLALKAIQTGGGSRDPKINQHLASVIAQAKANSVPFATLDRVLKAETVIDPYILEVQAPGGLFALVESCAKSVNSERQKIHSIAKKYGCAVLQTNGTISKDFFSHIGVIVAEPNSEYHLPDLDTATNLGIDIGASEVVSTSTDSELVYEFHCEAHEVGRLSKELQQRGITVLSAEDIYIPKARVQVFPDVQRNLQEMYSKIRAQHELVDRIFDNVSVIEDTSHVQKNKKRS